MGRKQVSAAPGAIATLPWRPRSHPCPLQVPQVVSSIHKKLMGISEVSLQDILKRTLFQMACLDPGQVVEGLLNTSLLCDRYGACQPAGQRRSSGAIAGRGRPPDRVLWVCSVAGAMWRTLVSKPCPAEEVLRVLLSCLREQPLLRRDSFMPKDSYILPLTVSFQARPHSALPRAAQPGQSRLHGLGPGASDHLQGPRGLPGDLASSPGRLVCWRYKQEPWLALARLALPCLGLGDLSAARPISGCFLQAIRALNEILLLPSSTVPVQLIFPQLCLAVLFQIFFSMEYTLQDLQGYSQMCGQEDECPPVSPTRCSIPLPWSLPRVQSPGSASVCDPLLLYMQERSAGHASSALPR